MVKWKIFIVVYKKKDKKLFIDCISVCPTYDAVAFRRRYRMSKRLLLKVHNTVANSDSYFIQKRMHWVY